MQPHGHAIGGRDTGNRIDQPVHRVKCGNVALGKKRNSQTESIAPEGQLTASEESRVLVFKWAVQAVRIAADGLEAE